MHWLFRLCTKIRRFLVETANDKRILFFCLLDGVNQFFFFLGRAFQHFFPSIFFFGFWRNLNPNPIFLCNGQLDFLFRLAQVEIAAVGDGHAQLIEHAVRQLGRSRAGSRP